jgi:hypothetical protein
MSNIGLLPLNNQGLRVGFNGDLVLGASLDDPYNQLCIVIGKNNQTQAYSDQAIVLGNNNTIQTGAGIGNILIGQNIRASATSTGFLPNDNILIGRNVTTGNGGQNVVIGVNSSTTNISYQSVAIGVGSKGSAANTTAIGSSSQATGSASVAIGNGATASAGNSIAIGSITASQNYSIAIGSSGGSRTCGDFHVGVAALTASQWGVITLGNSTADATQTELFSWPGLSSRFVLSNNSLTAFQGFLTRNTSNNDTAVWFVQGAVKRTTNAAATAIVGTPTSTQIAVDSGASTWTYVMDADTTNGSLRFRVTGVAATNIRWYIALFTTEIT